MVRALIIVSGLVQGVYYRVFTQRKARLLGLVGFVRNLSDTRVEVVCEGDRGLIEEFIKQLNIGPPTSDVRDLKITYQVYKGEFNGFDIRYS